MTNTTENASAQATDSPAKAARQLAALLSLIRLEADLQFGPHVLEGANAFADGQRYLYSFLNYLTETNQTVDTNLVATIVRTYSSKGGGPGDWPPRRFSGGDTLALNRAIDRGLDQFLDTARLSQKVQDEKLILLETVRDLAWAFQKQEEQLHRLAEDKGQITQDHLVGLTSIKNNLDKALLEAKNKGLYKEGAFSLEAQYTNLIAQGQVTSRKSFEEIYAVLTGGGRPVTQGLFSEIRRKLGNFESKTVAVIESSYRETTNAANLDKFFYADYQTTRSYAFRWAMYQRAFESKQSTITVNELLGHEWEAFGKLQENRKQIDGAISAYQGGYRREMANTCNYLLTLAEKYLYEDLVSRYVQNASAQLKAYDGVAEEKVSLDLLQNARAFLEKLDKDLTDTALVRVPADQQPKLTPWREKVSQSKTILARRYALARESELKKQVGFPVAFDDLKTTLFLEELQSLKTLIKTMEKESASPTLSYFPEPPWRSLKSKMALCTPILQGLTDDNNVPRSCKIRVLEPKNENDQAAAGRYREVDIFAGAKLPVHLDASRDFNKLVTCSLDQPLKIEIRKFTSDATTSNTGDVFKEWGVLGLIRKHETSRQVVRVDGRVWQVALPVKDGQREGVINLELAFDQPLPPLVEWPRIKDF